MHGLRVALLTVATLLSALLAAAGPAARAVAAASPTTDCVLPYGGTEGAINFDVYRRPLGTIRAVMLFVDFPDAPAAASAETVYEDIGFQDAIDWLERSSYGRLHLEITPLRKWLRMPEPTTAFPTTANALQGDARKRYLGEAIALADPEVDFSRYTIVYVVPNVEDKIQTRANASSNATGIVVDNTMIRSTVVFGSTVYTRGYGVLDHETGHIFGVPDYYSEDSSDLREYTGSWSVMGDTVKADDHFAWDKWRMGWLDNAQVACVNDETDDDYALEPLETDADGGQKALVLRTSLYTAIVAEYRTLEGNDIDVCSEGLLIYSVDTRVKGTHGPIHVSDVAPDTETGDGDCPYELDDAAYGTGDVFTDEDSGIELTVSGLYEGEADIHVSRPDGYDAPLRKGRTLTIKGTRTSSGKLTVTGVLTASGSFAPCAVAQKVNLQELRFGQWVTFATVATSKTRTWTYTFSGKPGTYRLYAADRFTSTYDCLPAFSKSLIVR